MVAEELIKTLKKESIYLAVLISLGIIIFKILFFKEDFLVVAKVVLSLFFIFIMPGFYLMYYWYDKLDFTNRFIIGFSLSAVLIGSISYHLGILGLNIKYHTFVLPLILLILAVVIIIRKKN